MSDTVLRAGSGLEETAGQEEKSPRAQLAMALNGGRLAQGVYTPPRSPASPFAGGLEEGRQNDQAVSYNGLANAVIQAATEAAREFAPYVATWISVWVEQAEIWGHAARTFDESAHQALANAVAEHLLKSPRDQGDPTLQRYRVVREGAKVTISRAGLEESGEFWDIESVEFGVNDMLEAVAISSVVFNTVWSSLSETDQQKNARELVGQIRAILQDAGGTAMLGEKVGVRWTVAKEDYRRGGGFEIAHLQLLSRESPEEPVRVVGGFSRCVVLNMKQKRLTIVVSDEEPSAGAEEATAEQAAKVTVARQEAVAALKAAAEQAAAEGAAPRMVLVTHEAMQATLGDGTPVADLVALLQEALPDRVFLVPHQWGRLTEIEGLTEAIDRIVQSQIPGIPVAIYVGDLSEDTSSRLHNALLIAFGAVRPEVMVASVNNIVTEGGSLAQHFVSDLGLPDSEGELSRSLDTYLRTASGLEQAELYL